MAIFKVSYKTVKKFSGGKDASVTKEKIEKGIKKKKIEELLEAKALKELLDY